MPLPESSAVSFVVSAPGYWDSVVVLPRSDRTSLKIQLRQRHESYLPGMTVTASSRCADAATYTESASSFTADDIKARAGAIDDIGRYIGTLPSTVASIGGGYDNTFFVRGGRPSEVVFVVDGIEMENINHFSKANGSGGPIGFINSDYLDNVHFFAGGMPLGSPPRLSSLVDINMKNGSFSKNRRSVGCKLTGGMISVEGPLTIDKSSFIFAGRYVDFMPLKTFIQSAGIPRLGDVFGKIALLSGESADITAAGLFSRSTYHFTYPIEQSAGNGASFKNAIIQNERIDQGGAGLSVHYKSGAISHEAHASVSFRRGSNADSLGNFSDTFFTNSYARNPVGQSIDGRRHLTASGRSVLPLPWDSLSLSLGARLNRNDYAFSKSDESHYLGEYVGCSNDLPDTVFRQLNPIAQSSRLSSTESGAFLELLYGRGLFAASGGLRADYYWLLGALALSPRLSASIRLDKTGTFSASCGMYHQFPTDMPSFMFDYFTQRTDASEDSLQKIEKTYMGRLQPLRCRQASCGYERKLLGTIEARVEGYYKWYDREYSYICPYVQDIFTVDDNGSAVLRDQNGRRKAYGVEILLRDNHDRRLFYSLGGSMLDVKNQYGGATWCNDWTNVGYTFSADVGCRIAQSHAVSFSLRGSGGLPLFSQTVSMDCMGRKSAALDTTVQYFSKRMSDLIVANLRYEYSMKIGTMGIEAFVEALNILNFTPTLEYKFNGERFVEVKPFGFTPIFGLTVHL